MMAVAVMMLAGCGSIDGTTCASGDTMRCDGVDISFCESSRWQTYACPSGCGANGCDWRGVKAGDACGEGPQGQGICTADGMLTVCVFSYESKVGRFVSAACAPCEKDKRLEDLVPQGKDGLYHCN